MTNYLFNFDHDNSSGNGQNMLGGDTLQIDAGYTLSSSNPSPNTIFCNGAASSGGNNTLEIYGTLSGTFDGFWDTGGGHDTINVYASGAIQGAGWGTAIDIYGGNNTLSNAGTIVGMSMWGSGNNNITNLAGGIITRPYYFGTGIGLVGGANTILNKGQITGGFAGIAISGSNNSITNNGSITPDSAGINISGDTNTIVNRGTVSGNYQAFWLYGAGSNSINNFGDIAVTIGVSYQPTITIFNVAAYSGGNLINNHNGATISAANNPCLYISDGFNIIRNSGSITAGGGYDAIKLGAVFSGGHNNVINSGLIESMGGPNGYSLRIAGTGNTVTNSGAIVTPNSGGGAIDIDGNSTITNAATGTISGAGGLSVAIAMHGGGNTINNAGSIEDFVFLGSNTQGDSFLGANGTFNGAVVGGKGDDTILVGTGDNYVLGDKGADFCQGGLGHTTFVYNAVLESNGTGAYGANMDTVDGFQTAGSTTVDRFEFASAAGTMPFLSAIAWDGKIGGTLNAANFAANVHAAVGLTLAADSAMLFTPNSGDLAGHVFLIVDGNGTAGYKAGDDYIVELTNLSSPKHIEQHIFWVN